ncbi:MAG TPA: methyltransferase domain-containing protein [Kofleriaceae bacterium]|nr:methyltransferase domain-containing protein [Kofleriaceae bacterium]
MGACSSSQQEPRTEVRPAPAPAFDADPSLPVGVLASSRGTFGEVRVEETGGQRRLVIDGIVQGAQPIGEGAERQGPDALVALIRTARPSARTVLCIGLGTGKTATDLTRAGLQVTTVEIEPAVIEYARRFFDFDGTVIQADGMQHLRTSTERYDVVLMDAFIGMDPPNDLVSSRGVRAMRERTAPRGLIIIRGLGEPRDFLYARIRADLRNGRSPWFVDFLGSGVGAEVQNLYLVASEAAINFVNVAGLPMWPVRGDDDGPAWAEPAAVGDQRQIRIVGYVVRLRESGALALDLPHWEMGSVRYLLAGAPAAELAALLHTAGGVAPSFPTAGDIASDGDSSHTLREVLGGGGSKRSDVRFSPLIAIVEGTASLRSVVHPDAAAGVPAEIRGDAPTDPLLPYGGALYDLQVHRIAWTLDRARWSAVSKRGAPHVRAATAAIAAGKLAAAAASLGAYLEVVTPAVEPFMPPRADMTRVVDALQTVAADLGAQRGPFAVAVACDRATVTLDERPLDAAAAVRMRAALQDCALASYEREAANHRNPNAISAAKRLFYLWDQLALTSAQQARADRKRADLDRKYRGPNPSPEPPAPPPPSR